jgi:hypothetical protein
LDGHRLPICRFRHRNALVEYKGKFYFPGDDGIHEFNATTKEWIKISDQASICTRDHFVKIHSSPVHAMATMLSSLMELHTSLTMGC